MSDESTRLSSDAMTADFAAMARSVSEAKEAFDRFGQAAQSAATVMERDFARLRDFAAERAIQTAIDRRFRRQLRLRRDRKNWRVKK